MSLKKGCLTCHGSLPDGAYVWCSDECYYIRSLWGRTARLHRQTINDFYQAHQKKNECLVCRCHLTTSGYCSEECRECFAEWFGGWYKSRPEQQEDLYIFFLKRKLMKKFGQPSKVGLL